MSAPTPQLIAADLIVIDHLHDRQRLLLIKRANDPFRDCYAFPGGFIEPNETVEAGAMRELAEETGLSGDSNIGLFGPRLIGIFSDPSRDPRGRVISAAFLIRVVTGLANQAKAGDDAKALEWVDVEQAARMTLAFDHNKILLEALRRL